MRRFIAIASTFAILMSSQTAFAVAAAPHAAQDEWAARVGVRGADRPTPADDEVRRLDRQRREELVTELASLAVLQILQPTTSPLLWEILGSDDGAEWRELGVFHVRQGEAPPARSGAGIPLRYLVGEVELADGRQIGNVVAEATSPTKPSLFPAGSRLFRVHFVERDAEAAAARREQSSRVAADIPPLDLGDDAGAAGHDEAAPSLEDLFATGASGTCLANCDSSHQISIDSCNSNYNICAAAATAASALCVIGCAGAAGTCLPLCAAGYAAAAAACLASKSSCYTTADRQRDLCVDTCSTACEGGLSSTGPAGDFGSVSAPLCPGTWYPDMSPLVIDLDGRSGFRFTDVAGGVRFDLDANGVAERTAWIAPGEEQAFLVLDRNGNGSIDDGGELFGDVTVQPPSDTPNGYLALALFDDGLAGGDGDGAIGPSDAVFPLLRLWSDENHDGVSQPGELRGLADAGVESVDLDHVVSNRRDRHGNLLRYTASVQMADRVVHSTDVFFLVEEAGD